MTSNPTKGSAKNSADDRRRRTRLPATSTPGWVIAEGAKPAADPWLVRVTDVSRHGVGFESFEQLNNGQICRIRIGRGPLELAKRIRVIRCAPAQDGTFAIGGEFF